MSFELMSWRHLDRKENETKDGNRQKLGAGNIKLFAAVSLTRRTKIVCLSLSILAKLLHHY
jgi:hypothetical protein